MLERIRNAFERLRLGGDVDDALREIQRALILSDVNVKTVKELTERIKERIREEKKKYPGVPARDLAYKIIFEEIVNIMGGKGRPFPVVPQKILLVGLFGSGKTTTAAKLAKWFKKRGLKPLLVALDVHRPAAYHQLKQLAEKVGVDFYGEEGARDPVGIAERALEVQADVYIFDSAGRSALDDELMEELRRIKEVVIPDKTLLVIPADIGQVAAREAREFNERVGIDGVVITKMDGSGKAGGALTACHEAGVPVYFIGTGESPDDLEEFDAERFVGRLLGVPDLKALMERFQGKEEDLEELLKGEFDINAFYKQLKAFNEMGPLDKVLQMLGISTVPEDVIEDARKKFKKYDAIYKSMTKQERAHPEILNESRIRRIARGSGTTVEDVRAFLRDYRRAKKMFEKLRKSRGRNLERILKRMGMRP